MVISSLNSKGEQDDLFGLEGFDYMKKKLFLSIIIVILFVGMVSGCVEINPKNGGRGPNTNSYQPWNDGTITLRDIQYSEKYNAEIGDYRTVAIQIEINYDVYINTDLSGFSLETSKGKILRGLTWEGNGYSPSSWTGPFIKLDKESSPGCFKLYLSYGETISFYNYDYIIEKNEIIKSFIFTVADARSSVEYTIPINENMVSNENNQQTLTINPTDDTFINKNNPSGNMGSANWLRVCGSTEGTINTLVKFGIPSISKCATIESATLKLFYYKEPGAGDPSGHRLLIYKIINNWTENNVTWDTQPSYSPTVSQSGFVPTNSDVWMEFDVTIDVQSFISGKETNYGWKVIDSEGTPEMPYFYSKESGSNIPYLEIKIIN